MKPKEYIKSGSIVEMNDGGRYLVVWNQDEDEKEFSVNCAFLSGNNSHISMSYFDDELNHVKYPTMYIKTIFMYVNNFTRNDFVFDKGYYTDELIVEWEREKDSVNQDKIRLINEKINRLKSQIKEYESELYLLNL